jgi:hypothetical protein
VVVAKHSNFQQKAFHFPFEGIFFRVTLFQNKAASICLSLSDIFVILKTYKRQQPNKEH